MRYCFRARNAEAGRPSTSPLLRSLLSFVSIPLEGLVVVFGIPLIATVIVQQSFYFQHSAAVSGGSSISVSFVVLRRHISYCLQHLFSAPHEVTFALYRSNCALFVKAYLSRRITSLRDPPRSLTPIVPLSGFLSSVLDFSP